MKKLLPLAALAGLALATSVHGALLVYEGFDYTPASETNDPGAQNTSSEIILTGKGGTTEVGLSGTWANAQNDGENMYLVEGSLSFGDLATSGNHIRYRSNLQADRFNRGITADLDSGTELWFSFLGNKLDTRSAAQEGIVIGNQLVGNAQIGQDNATTTGMRGFGIGSSGGNNWTAYGYAADGTASNGSFGITVGQTNLLVGRIQFNAALGGEDIFTAYHYDRAFASGSVTADMANLVQFGQLEVDVDESLLDTLNVTRQVNTAYDEIRIGTTIDSVIVAIPEPTTALLGSLGMFFLLRRRR